MDGSEFSTMVRLGEVETLKESGSKGIGVRVFFGQERGQYLLQRPDSGGHEDRWWTRRWRWRRSPAKIRWREFPSRPNWASWKATSVCTTTMCIRSRRRTASTTRDAPRKRRLRADPRIVNSEGGTFDAAMGYKVLANSHGFVGDNRRSYCSVSAVPIAQVEGSAMQRDYWYSVAIR